MKPDYLPRLSDAASAMLQRGMIPETMRRLRAELANSQEPFVWAPLGLRGNDELLPSQIRSAWLFALKANAWTGAHFHPNSIQHMIVIAGRGQARVGGAESRLVPFDPDAPSDDQWCVIEAAVPHEFYPEGEDMIVMSFHTASPDELVEVSVDSQAARRYEK